MNNFAEIIQKLKDEKFIVILRNLPGEMCEKTVDALYRGGVRIFEVTFNPSKADTVETTTGIMRMIKSKYPDVTLAAGTVVKEEFVKAAHEAGAVAIVSPNTDAKIIALTHELGMMSMPGAFTPSEIMTAYNLGADIVKVFPIEPHNIPYLKNIMSPLSHIPFLPTGGVNVDTAAEFLKAGAVAVAAGATVITPAALEAEDYDAIEQNARDLIAACNR